MWHAGMDAIDYEPDADLIDGLNDSDNGSPSGSNSYSEDEEDESSDWERYNIERPDGYKTDDSEDEASKRFPPQNLRNPKTFPSYVQCSPFELYEARDWNNEPMPPPRHWCYLGEVEETGGFIRNSFTLKDKDDLTTNFDPSVLGTVKEGYTIAILYAEKKYFSLGVYGLRVDHAKFVKVFPCDLDTLLRINDDIEESPVENCAKKCKECGKEADADTKLLRCSQCRGVSYCGKDCQTAAWKDKHKRECKIFSAVIELKESRDWGIKKPLKWVAFGQRE
ncbi:hypothetical protein FB45DRAFT_900905 [Roridomyces roridus]|uniref:MYND-type domain-containing protein n=1 Tax=Roridomyces roridus TaxID=1738132 RepID=A0AAD7FVR4_9AGAR|nr:hypothetical protein FB45DRAFT_900905 [Roridomyces roridus]